MTQIRQTRIFAPMTALFSHAFWAETLLGHIIKPSIYEFEQALTWYWFTRYVQTPDGDSGDCVLSDIPKSFMDPGSRYYKSIRFRYAVADDKTGEFEDYVSSLIDHVGCAISDFREYNILEDLGGDRHIEEPRTPERRQRRAQLVVQNYFSVARLILDALAGPDGDRRYWLPHQKNYNPQQETPFGVFRHVYCNAIGVPG